MNRLRRIVLLRHGDTVGNSRERFHGSSDVALSDEGRAQVRAAGRRLATEVFEVVAASPLRRAWQSAALLCDGAPMLLVPEFREIDFGRWEGSPRGDRGAGPGALPHLAREGAPTSSSRAESGARRSSERSAEGLATLARTGAENALVVAHRGVIRALAIHLLGEPLAAPPSSARSSRSRATASAGSWAAAAAIRARAAARTRDGNSTIGPADDPASLPARITQALVPAPVRQLGRELGARLRETPTRLNGYGFDPYGFHPDTARRGLLPSALLYRYYFRVETHGIASMPQGRLLLIGNHSVSSDTTARCSRCRCCSKRVRRGCVAAWRVHVLAHAVGGHLREPARHDGGHTEGTAPPCSR
jgi:broad specificity phosphatase PhoE